jgi:hypothetical protein
MEGCRREGVHNNASKMAWSLMSRSILPRRLPTVTTRDTPRREIAKTGTYPDKNSDHYAHLSTLIREIKDYINTLTIL